MRTKQDWNIINSSYIKKAWELQKMKELLKWYNLFVDYVEDQDNNLYNEGCDYADDNE